MQLTINSLGNVINFYRKEKKITQKELADEFNVTQGAISQAIYDYKNKYTDSDLRKKIIAYIKAKNN
jgi:transcriptional regulator with XRE-family HTH domain